MHGLCVGAFYMCAVQVADVRCAGGRSVGQSARRKKAQNFFISSHFAIASSAFRWYNI